MGFALKREHYPNYTYDDYLRWEGHWELIDGIPYAMWPLPSIRHQQIAANLLVRLTEALKNCNQCTATLPIDWKVAYNTVIQPDVLVVCNPLSDGNFIDEVPTLVVEVLSPSTRDRDLLVKPYIYEEQKVKYCVIVDPNELSISGWQHNGTSYTKVLVTKEGHFTFEFDNECSAQIDLGKIWR